MATNVAAVHGRINDLDSHLQVPISRWAEVFGDATARFGERFAHIAYFDDTDEPELTTESVWTTKSTAAPGACTPEGRLAALDMMGIERQLIFPQVILAASAWAEAAPWPKANHVAPTARARPRRRRSSRGIMARYPFGSRDQLRDCRRSDSLAGAVTWTM